MKKKRLKISAVLLLGLGLTGLQAQTMYVKERSGTQTAYTLNSIQKISFASGNLTLTKTDNSSSVYALSDLRYLNFSDTLSGLNEPLSVQNQMLNVYPNPVNNTLNIDLTGIAKAEGTLSILNVQGKTLVSRQVSNEGVLSLDITHLSEGIYLCRYSNATEVKTVKIIKQ
ncbi:MAG: T9SS type A sorting domain-containing protein [Bacteroidales bacterium]|nr:T9SS type A sorting domain-containing protein [Bacteroidales bacterium]